MFKRDFLHAFDLRNSQDLLIEIDAANIRFQILRVVKTFSFEIYRHVGKVCKLSATAEFGWKICAIFLSILFRILPWKFLEFKWFKYALFRQAGDYLTDVPIGSRFFNILWLYNICIWMMEGRLVRWFVVFW